jgi:DNA-binding GntR family transcriptional regulator
MPIYCHCFSKETVLYYKGKSKEYIITMKEEGTLELERLEDASATDKATSLPTRTSTSSQGEVAYAALRRRIIHCELEPGERITEAQLASETRIGKTPVREALTRLIQDGLVRSMPGHGYEVTPITLGDVQDLYNFRLIIEPAAAQLAAGHVSATDLRRLDELCAARFSTADKESQSRYLQANYLFHTTIADASGNRRLAGAVRRALEESERLFHLSSALKKSGDDIAHEHTELVDALIAGDGETARKLTLAHLTASQRRVLDALLASPSLLAVNILPLRRKNHAEN